MGDSPTWTTRSTRSSTTVAFQVRASSTFAATSASARTTATPAPGASRCCPKSFATTRSTSSSAARTRPRLHSSRLPTRDGRAGTAVSPAAPTHPSWQTRHEHRRSPRGDCMSAPAGSDLDRDGLVWMYHQMLRIREFEERVKRTFLDHPGVIRGHTHLADGAEASIVGSIATLGPDDQFFTTYRCHGAPIARGSDVKAMMAEIYGRKDG